MTTLVAHISDLHFGEHDPRIAAALLGELDGTTAPRPALVAISGDLTQRARRAQFRAARAFLDALAPPFVVVPGNHDIPLYDVVTRFLRPLDRYRRLITADPCPVFVDSELAVCGLGTAHPWTVKGGRVQPAQLEHVRATFARHPHHWKLVVAHHPFVIPEDGDPADLVDGAAWAVPQLEAARADLVLTGHLHVAHSHGSAGRNPEHTLVVVHAGTCMSTRLRGEPNGYNQLQFDGDRVTIVHRAWDGRQFVDVEAKAYHRAPGPERMIKDADTALPPPGSGARRA